MQPSPQASSHQKADDDLDFALLDEIVSGKGQLSIKASETIRARVRAWTYSGGARRLIECFRWLPKSGERSIFTQLAESRRLAAFIEAWDALPAAFPARSKDTSDWDWCGVLEDEIESFNSNYWPGWRESGLPAKTSKLRAALFRYFSALERQPAMKQAGIYELLKRARCAQPSKEPRVSGLQREKLAATSLRKESK